MSTIYLIDQSLLDDSGHHADYAGCLIEAASNAGLKTVLAANRQLSKWLKKNQAITTAQFFQNDGSPIAAERLGRPGRVFHKSTSSTSSTSLSQPISFLSDVEVHCSFRNTTYSRYSDLADLRRMNRNHSISFTSRTFNPLGGLWRRARQEQYVRQFAADCNALFSNVEFGNSDHIFFTTINELELLGLARFLAQKSDSTVPQWHVQFHFGLFLGRPPEYQAQRHEAEIVRQTFMDAMGQLSYQNLHFYTTSSELADQYNRLGIGLFETLPYPVSPHVTTDPSAIASLTSPLKVACPGGIRREKGQIKYLQDLVDQAWKTLFEPQKIQLILQRPESRQRFAAMIKKNKLEIRLPPAAFNCDSNASDTQMNKSDETSRFGKQKSHPVLTNSPGVSTATSSGGYRIHSNDNNISTPIVYLPHPLPRDEYTRFIRETDIGLLFYDSRVYYSRRAGILGELLAAGKPVIVPAGCWLSEQIAEPNFHYATRIIEQHSFERIGLGDIGWSIRNAPAAGGKISFDHDRNLFQFEFEIPACQQVGLSFDWVWPVKQGIYCQVDLELLDSHGVVREHQSQVVGHRKEGNFLRGPMNPTANQVSVLFTNRCQATQLRGSLKNAFSDSTICVNHLAFDFIRQFDQDSADGNRRHSLPSGAVGLSVANPQSILSALIEIVEHYPHYRATAEQFAKGWIDDHDPDLVVHRLLREELEFSEVA